MKKIICLLLAVSLIITLCGCGKKNQTADKLTQTSHKGFRAKDL